MVKTREAVRNARGLLLILLAVSLLSLAMHRDQEAAPEQPSEAVTP